MLACPIAFTVHGSSLTSARMRGASAVPLVAAQSGVPARMALTARPDAVSISMRRSNLSNSNCPFVASTSYQLNCQRFSDAPASRARSCQAARSW